MGTLPCLFSPYRITRAPTAALLGLFCKPSSSRTALSRGFHGKRTMSGKQKEKTTLATRKRNRRGCFFESGPGATLEVLFEELFYFTSEQTDWNSRTELAWPPLHGHLLAFLSSRYLTQEGCRDVNSSQKSRLISAGQHLQHTKFLCVLRNSSKMIVAAQQFALCHLVLRYISLVSLCPVACEALRLSFRTTNCPTGPWHLPDHSRHWWKRD